MYISEETGDYTVGTKAIDWVTKFPNEGPTEWGNDHKRTWEKCAQ